MRLGWLPRLPVAPSKELCFDERSCCYQANYTQNLLASKKDVQEVHCKRGKNCSGYLKADPIPFGEQVAPLANT